jgi:hypothetical protein
VQFQPKSKSEIEKERVAQGAWPVGNYEFEVLDRGKVGTFEFFTEERKSQNGNEMIQLVLSVTHPIGIKRVLRDYLLDSVAVKLHDAAAACGLIDQYNAGSLIADDFVGEKGVLKLGIEKDATGLYADRNNVRGYVIGDVVVSSEPPF